MSVFKPVIQDNVPQVLSNSIIDQTGQGIVLLVAQRPVLGGTRWVTIISKTLATCSAFPVAKVWPCPFVPVDEFSTGLYGPRLWRALL